MENQHQKITGYRDLNQAEIDAMNEIKALGQQVGDLLHRFDGPVGTAENGRFHPDGRWLAIARTTLQTGFMQLTRAVAKPESF